MFDENFTPIIIESNIGPYLNDMSPVLKAAMDPFADGMSELTLNYSEN